jgi:hypothetical protein
MGAELEGVVITTMTDKYRLDLARLEGGVHSIARTFTAMGEQLLEECTAIAEIVRQMRASLDSDLRQGFEGRAFAPALDGAKSFGADVMEAYAVARNAFKGWHRGEEALTPLIQEAEAFVARVNELLASVNKPFPPIDESQLPSAPVAPAGEAPGFVSVSEARARLHERRKG